MNQHQGEFITQIIYRVLCDGESIKNSIFGFVCKVEMKNLQKNVEPTGQEASKRGWK